MLYPRELSLRYGDEMQWVFREELKRAARSGPSEYVMVWCNVFRDTTRQIGPDIMLRFGITSAAIVGTLAIMLPVLLAVPTRLPPADLPCLPKVYASSMVQQPYRPELSGGSGHESENKAETEGAVPVHARNARYRRPSRPGHST